jgi:DNA-binding protein HU-beta
MNKQDLVKRIAFDAEVTQRQASVMVDSMIRIIMDSVAGGDRVMLSGFGTFESKRRAARTVYNVFTQEQTEIPEKVVPVFKAGVEFKEAVGE